MTTSLNNFKAYNLSAPILKAIEGLHFTKPTSVQEAVIPKALEGKDLLVKSQTGSGKTAAFAIPICEMLDWEENKPQVLVLTPTRELALQVKEDFFNIGRFKRVKTVGLYGKAPFHIQEKELKQKTHVVVGTPGRVLDHLDRGTFITDEIRYIVIDEADEMFKMGFIDEVERILKTMPKERMTLLFSATLAPSIEALSQKFMKSPLDITIESKHLTADRIEQVCYKVNPAEKLQCLENVLIAENPECCMIFANTKDQVDEIEDYLKDQDMSILKIHGGMEQRDRFAAMEDFRRGKFRYLVATDVAARGIDIDHITHVINFDVPEDKESYVHRIGRTGRGGRTGKSITLATSRDGRFLNAIYTYTGFEVPVSEAPTREVVKASREAFEAKHTESLKLEPSK
ncbi:MAG: DEAD/DEAH box helicase, partial [Niameybacter sp.]